MKKIVLLLITFISFSTYSQVDRRIGRGQYERTPKNHQKQKADFTEESLEFFRKEIEIDGFQEAVIKNLLDDYEKSSKEIAESESIEAPKKKELLLNVVEKFKTQLTEILTAEQYEKYKNLMDSNKKKRKK